jgi:hypothetical protein
MVAISASRFIEGPIHDAVHGKRITLRLCPGNFRFGTHRERSDGFA